MGMFFTMRKGLFSLKLHTAHCLRFSLSLFLLHSLSLALLALAFLLREAHVPLYTAWRLLFSSCLLSSPLLKQRLAVLYFKVISSNFISCSKKFLPESAIDVITTST
ncbi:hypothetical protein LDENG_00292220 [Lucifuga dentata]|nr:hypothetical protein LDENG_00292220 [Lucifuga dentata]